MALQFDDVTVKTIWFGTSKNTEQKKSSIGVSQNNILIDATISFQIKPWGYEEMKNSDEKVNIKAFRDVRKRYLGRRDYSTIRE